MHAFRIQCRGLGPSFDEAAMDDLDLMMSDRQLALTLPPAKTQGVKPKAKKKAVKNKAVKAVKNPSQRARGPRPAL